MQRSIYIHCAHKLPPSACLRITADVSVSSLRLCSLRGCTVSLRRAWLASLVSAALLALGAWFLSLFVIRLLLAFIVFILGLLRCAETLGKVNSATGELELLPGGGRSRTGAIKDEAAMACDA